DAARDLGLPLLELAQGGGRLRHLRAQRLVLGLEVEGAADRLVSLALERLPLVEDGGEHALEELPPPPNPLEHSGCVDGRLHRQLLVRARGGYQAVDRAVVRPARDGDEDRGVMPGALPVVRRTASIRPPPIGYGRRPRLHPAVLCPSIE